MDLKNLENKALEAIGLDAHQIYIFHMAGGFFHLAILIMILYFLLTLPMIFSCGTFYKITMPFGMS